MGTGLGVPVLPEVWRMHATEMSRSVISRVGELGAAGAAMVP